MLINDINNLFYHFYFKDTYPEEHCYLPVMKIGHSSTVHIFVLYR